MGAALERLAGRAAGGADRDAGHGRAMASSRVRHVLALELATSSHRSAAAGVSSLCVDSPDARSEPLWGAPRIHGELLKLGIEVSQATVAKYLGRSGGPPSQSWRTFLTNQVSQLASIDFFTVPTATFRVLFVFVVLSHHRRRIVHVNVTAHPTAAWTAQQLRETWPWDTAPRFVIRDRDRIYGVDPRRTAQQMGIDEVRRHLVLPGRIRTLSP